MYATLYGQRTEIEPDERHFHRGIDGAWNLQKSSLPSVEIMHAFERLDRKCLMLLFDSADQFWDTVEKSDFNIIHAGLDPEALCSRDDFNRACMDMQNPLERKLIFYYCVRNYSHVAQNIVNHILISLGDAYALLSEPNLHEDIPLDVQSYGHGEGYRNTSSPSGFRIWTNINFCIEKTVSFLDYTAKYVFELSNIKPDIAPGKPKAAHITFGKWNDAKLARGTSLSAMSNELRLLTALRDETVHSGTIDHFSRIYEHTIGAQVKRRFILLPDHDNGKILTAPGRKRFYNQDNHLNSLLPTVLDRVFGDALSSLNQIDNNIASRWNDPESYFTRYSEVSETIENAAKTGTFIKFSPIPSQK